MMRILAVLCALCLLISQVSAGVLINSFHIFTGPATITLIGCTDGPGGSPVTFAAHSVGAEAATRKTIVGISTLDDAATYTVDSVTIGGGSATEVVDEGGSGTTSAAIYIMDNPSGTTEDIVITFSEAIAVDVDICVLAATGVQSSTPVDTAAAFSTDSSVIDVSVDTLINGVVIGVSGAGGLGHTITWTGITERFDADNTSGADLAVASSSTPLSVTADWDGTNDSTAAVASFR